jgi:hypothetical protein
MLGQLRAGDGNLEYMQLIGGEGDDKGQSIAVDMDGNLFLTGNTNSFNAQANTNSGTCIATTGNNFPLCDAGNSTYYQNTHYGTSNSDIFVMKFNQNNVLQWSTFYGSASDDEVFELNLTFEQSQIPSPPDVLLVGKTNRTSTTSACTGNPPANGDFPLCNPAGLSDYFQLGSGAFISRFDNEGNILWATNFNNIKEFQTVTASEDYIYAVGLTEVLKPTVGGTSTCAPPTGTGEFPICTPTNSYSQASGRSTYIVKIQESNNSLRWSTLFGDGTPSYSGPSTDILGGSTSHPLKLVDPKVAPVAKHMDAVVSSDDQLFILGTTLEELDYKIKTGNYNQTENRTTDGNNIPDAFIAYFDPAEQLQWASLFGDGNTTNPVTYGGSPNCYPRNSEFGSAISLVDNELIIVGYAGGVNNPANINYPYCQLPFPSYYSEHNAWGVKYFNGFIAQFDTDVILNRNEYFAGTSNPSTIFPNPAHSNFAIILPGKYQQCNVSVYSITGQLVARVPSYREGRNIAIDHLPAGMYIVQMSEKDWIASTKLIKE